MSEISKLMEELREVYGLTETQGFVETLLPGVRFFCSTESVRRVPLVYDAGIIIVGQGRKTCYLKNRTFNYDETTPLECDTHASPDSPLLGIFIDIDMTLLHQLVALIGKYHLSLRDEITSVLNGIEPVLLAHDILDTTVRLLKCLGSAPDCDALGPALIKEIIYRALLG